MRTKDTQRLKKSIEKYKKAISIYRQYNAKIKTI